MPDFIRRITRATIKCFDVCWILSQLLFADLLARWRTRRYLRRMCHMPKCRRVAPAARGDKSGGWSFVHRGPVSGAIDAAGSEVPCPRAGADTGTEEADTNSS